MSKLKSISVSAFCFFGLCAFTCAPTTDAIVFRVPTYHPPAQCAQSMNASHARLEYYEPGWRGASSVIDMQISEIVPAISYDAMGDYWLAVVNDTYYDAQGCSASSEPTHCVKRAADGSWVHIMIRQSYWDACPSPYSIKSRGAQAVGRAHGLGWSSGNGTSVMHRPPNVDVPSTPDRTALSNCTGLGYSVEGPALCPVP